MYLYLFLGLFVGLAGALLLYFLVIKKSSPKPTDLADDFFARFSEKFPQIINQANQTLVTMASQKLDAQQKQVSSDLAAKKDTIQALADRILTELKTSAQKLETAERQRIGSFENLRQALDSQQKITKDLSATTDALKKVLSNNQLRGSFGEKIAEDLLKTAGFVKGVNYQKQKTTSDSRPDFTVFLPDGVSINIDAKFPYQNLTKMAETKNSAQRRQFLAAFKQDVKDKIKQVSTRDYINPEANTVDFVILFIPNEMIFSFIYDKMADVWEQALRQKVIFAGPFSFTAILRMVLQAHDNFRFQKNIQAIIGQIRLFAQEFDKYNAEFDKLGPRIDSLSRQYQQVAHTRTNKLLRVVDQIKLDQPAPLKSSNETV